MTRGGIVVLVLLAAAPAQAVDAPITGVTVFSDRARIRRRGYATAIGDRSSEGVVTSTARATLSFELETNQGLQPQHVG